MSLEAIKYSKGSLEILDQLLLPVQSKYLAVKGVEDGWKVINKMQVCVNKKQTKNIFSFRSDKKKNSLQSSTKKRRKKFRNILTYRKSPIRIINIKYT